MGSFLDDSRERWRDVTVETDVAVRMRDGIVLRADIYRPTTHCACPVLLMRTPYDKAQAQNICFAHPTWYARRGFIVVVQDCRGRYRSDGECTLPARAAGQHRYDRLGGKYQGSTGQVVIRFSYSGVVQLLAAVEKPSPLAAIMPALPPQTTRATGSTGEGRSSWHSP